MANQISFGEYVRRLRRSKRWELQQLARTTGLSLSHLSRIENDHAVPTPETIVKLAISLEGDLTFMLQLANNLPKEILESLIDRTKGVSDTRHRMAGAQQPDPSFAKALLDEIDPSLRSKLAQHFGLEERDVDGIFSVLQKLAQMNADEREAVIGFLTSSRGTEGSE